MFRTILSGLAKATRSVSKGRRPAFRPAMETLEERNCPTTVQAFAAALDHQILRDVGQFIHDAAVVEVHAPTLGVHNIARDLVQMNADVHHNALAHVFADFQTLGRTLIAEAEVTLYYNLAHQHALLAYSKIVSDLVHVAEDKAITVAFVDYIASHSHHHTTAPTSSVLGSGLFAPGTIGGDTQAILAQEYQNSLTNYHGPNLGSYDHYFRSLSGSIAASATFDSLAQNVNPSNV